jgi:glycosyltransferase 2 family protein
MRGKRWAPWITLAVVVAILFMLSRALRHYDFAEVWQSVRSADRIRLALAIAFAACSYFMLTLFDTLAVRYLHRKLPYRRTALASFTGLSIGHTVGLAAFSSGAVRYRFYSRWGLSAQDIGKLIVFCALTVGLGLITLAGLAWTLRPTIAADMTGLPRGTVHAVGFVCLGLSAAWLVLAIVRRRPIRILRWKVALPSLPLAAAQIAVGTVNFGLVAASLHACIRSVAEARYVEVAAAYVIANTAAIVSHVPGGLGVIEVVVTYLLPQANILGAVLLFRAVYYLLPLPLGLASFIVAEFYYRRRGRAADAEKDVSRFVSAPARR